MKKRKNEISHSNSKYFLNLSESNFKPKKSRFDILYENSSIHDKKLDLVRAKIYYNQQERMTPDITPKSKKINRKQELFYKRLYKSDNETSTDVSKIKNTSKEKNKLKISKVIKMTMDEKENEKNNSKSVISSKVKNGNLFLKDDENLYIMDNKKKNELYKQFYKSSKIKSRNTSFIFKPTINDKSKYLASKMKTNSSQRLFTLSLRQKENLKTIYQRRKQKSELNLKTEKEKKLLKTYNYSYKPNVKYNKRKWIDNLYEKGINSIKKKEEEIKKEKELIEKEYLQYSFTPKINHNYSYSYSFLNKLNSVSIDSSKNNYPKGLYNNTSFHRKNINSLNFNKTSFYERNKTWKKSIEQKKEQLRKKIKNENSFTNDESKLNKKSGDDIMKTDESFIKRNYIEYQTFLDKYNQKIIKKNLDKINYRKRNIPPKKVYAKKLILEFVNECDSNCPTNFGTIKFCRDKRPINEINKNRDGLKINDFFKDDIKLETKNVNKYEQEYLFNLNKHQNDRNYKTLIKHKKNYTSNLSFLNAVTSLINKIE